MKKKPGSVISLIVELVLTVCVCSSIVLTNMNMLSNEAQQYTSEIQTDYKSLTDRYVSVFKAIVMHIGEEIEKDPSFDDMQMWLQAHNGMFADAVGKDVFDGLAMTYKGGYAHSWDYGDYSDYDPSTRIWYQDAEAAGGEPVVVAPYVTYLDPSYLDTDQYIELSVAQKYSDEVSFDLDIKISEINGLLGGRSMGYGGTQTLLFDKNGYIIASSDSALYCHNVNATDDVITQGLSEDLLKAKEDSGTLKLMDIDGSPRFVYISLDDGGNAYCVMIPFTVVFMQSFLVIALIMTLLIILEIMVFNRNRRVIAEMAARDNCITGIARAAFQKQIFVDMDTMKYMAEPAGWADSEDGDYEALYRRFLSEIPAEPEKRVFSDMISPVSLEKLNDSGLVSSKITMEVSTKDGSMLRKIVEMSAFISSLNGKKTAVIMANDVTAEEQDQQRIMKSITHHYFAVFVGSTGTGRTEIIKTDGGYGEVYEPHLSFSEISSRYALKYVRDEYVGGYINATDTETIRRRLASSVGYSLTFGLKDGHWRTLRIIRSSDTGSRDFIFFAEDADEQMRQQEKLEEALKTATQATKAKTDFLSRMSHDIRTPMNGIIGMTRIAMEQSNPPKTEDALRKIDLSSKYLLVLINDILDMTKIESGELKLHTEPYPASEFFKYLDSVIRPLCEARGQTLEVNGEINGTCIPVLDKLRINQVVFNLLSNAVKYTPDGGTIRLHNEERINGDKLELTISVIDNGRGMSEEFQEVLFEPFTQEDRVRSMESMSSSSGLGLAIVKKIVNMMNGTIEVESRLNKGSRFTIRILTDYVTADKYKSAAEEGEASCEKSNLKGRKVLLCEDNAINQEIARSILEQAGMEVTLADNGKKGADIFANSPVWYFSYVLMDIRMPEMDGYEATRTIRNMDRADAAAVPIFAMTADAFEDDIQQCREAGMNGHIPKPLDPEQVYKTLGSLFGAGGE